jgi:hypothetical protein
MADLSTLTVDELRGRIEQERRLHDQLTADRENARRESEEAQERQRLRRELEGEMRASSTLRQQRRIYENRRSAIDNDNIGAHLPQDQGLPRRPDPVRRCQG